MPDDSIQVVRRWLGRLAAGLGVTHLEPWIVEFPWGSVIRVCDGKIISACGYPTPQAAKEAAGLSG